MNLWIRLRDCFLRKSKNQNYLKLYELLHSLVEEDKVICPISQRIFYELLKQEDDDSLLNTAKVIDKFSRGVTLLSEPEREQSELQYYVRKKILEDNNLIPVDEFIWAKVPYVMGIVIPTYQKVPIEIQSYIQHKFFDYSWNVSLEELVSIKSNKNVLRDILRNDKTVKAMNIGKLLSNNEISSIRQLFLNELEGALSIYKGLVEDFLKYLLSKNDYILVSLKKRNLDSSEKLLKKIYDDIKSDEISCFLPSLFIHICLHTLVRWDKKRKYKPNDINDFYHAISALPYFDYFFTEKPLTQLVRMGPYHLDKRYKKIVEFDPIIILDRLTECAN